MSFVVNELLITQNILILSDVHFLKIITNPTSQWNI